MRGGVKLHLTRGIFAPDITFLQILYIILLSTVITEIFKNNQLNRKYVEEIIIGEYHVCFSLVFAFPFVT